MNVTPSPRTVVRLGTRGSALARAQTELVAQGLREHGSEVELVVVQTAGDRRAPDTAWGEGAFVAALEEALLAGRVDVAVHSAKDLPTRQDERLTIAAYLPRADPRDALVCRERGGTLATLPAGSRVGTDSPRRTGFLLAQRPDLHVHPLSGNVDTRLRRLDSGETDALVLAVAGLARLGRADRIDELLDPGVVPPAPGQGAIAVQIRADDATTASLVGGLDDDETRAAVEGERAFLRSSGGGCRAPIGSLARVAGEELLIRGGYVRPDGSASAWAEVRGDVSAAARLGSALAAQLGSRLGVARPPRVLVTRPAAQAQPLIESLRVRGLDPVLVPAIEIEQSEDGELDAAADRLADYDWVVVTSANGAEAMVEAAKRAGRHTAWPRCAAVGAATASALSDRGIRVEVQPDRSTAADLARAIPVARGDRVLVARAEIAPAELPELLRARGAVVDEVVAYRTREAPETSRGPLEAALDGDRLASIVFTSGSTVRGLLALADEEGRSRLRGVPAVCIGPRTAEVAREQGFQVAGEAKEGGADSLADVVAQVAAGQRRD